MMENPFFKLLSVRLFSFKNMQDLLHLKFRIYLDPNPAEDQTMDRANG